MELAAFVTTLIVVILQIITIALVVGTRKIVRDQVDKANQALSNEKSGDRRERDFRTQNRKFPQEQKQKPAIQQPAATTGSVDTVEKSLRDINLKLKNAERDQEFARRKVQENFSRDPNRRHNGNDRNNRGGRDNRDHHHGQDRNRDRRGGNWQERNKSREPLNFGPAQPAQQSDEAQNLENLNPTLVQDQIQQNLTQESPASISQPAIVSESTPDIVANDFSTDENLQHGRKILVKRRVLKEDEISHSENEESSSPEGSPVNISSEEAVSENSDVVGKTSEGEIRFGRR